MYLPRIDGAAEAAPAKLVAVGHGGHERVLVAEDEPGVRRVTVRVLREAGYEVVEASNGAEALLKLDALPEPPHLVLTDVVMPQMGGRELADKIRARFPNVRVLYVSGYTENAIVHRGVLDPGLVFLEKPFSEDQLLRKVRELLDAKPA